MYEITTKSYADFVHATQLLSDAGIAYERRDTVSLRGARSGMGYGPVGDVYIYTARTSATLEEVMAAIPAASNRLDLEVCNVDNQRDGAYLSYARALAGEWHNVTGAPLP